MKLWTLIFRWAGVSAKRRGRKQVLHCSSSLPMSKLCPECKIRRREMRKRRGAQQEIGL